MEGETNLIAVKLYQVDDSSGDITFGCEIRAIVDALPAVLSVGKDMNNGAFTLTWKPGTGSVLYESDIVTAPEEAWSVVAGASSGSYSLTPPSAGRAQRFFVLRR